MQHHFQTDISGVLEYATVTSPSCDFVHVLQGALLETLNYFKRSPDALDALHIVLFRAWHNKEEYLSNFSISRYQRGIQTNEYIRLMDLNNLFERTMSHLYEMPIEEAIDALQQLILADPSPRYLTYYFRITNTISDNQQYSRAIDFITQQKLNTINENDFINISALIHEQQQLQKNTTLPRSVKLTRLMAWLQSNTCITFTEKSSIKSNDLPRKRRIIIKTLDDIRKETADLRTQWNNNNNNNKYSNAHEKAFIIICQHLHRHTQPKRSLEYKEVQLQQQENEKEKSVYDYDNGDNCTELLNNTFDRMIRELSLDKNNSVTSWKLWCLQVLLERSSGFKSVMIAMVQFSDLWIKDWLQPYAKDTFVSLIIKENLLTQYYHHFYKVFYCIPSEEKEGKTVTDLCFFFFHLLINITDKKKSLVFRDYVYQHISTQYSIDYNLFDIDNPPINMDAELTKAFNQCNSETVVWDSTMQRLTALTTIHPKAVVMEMVAQCCLNKDRHSTTIPVLRSLGKLCRTRVKQIGKSTTTTTLLVHCLKLLLDEWSIDMIRDNLINITTFIKACSEGLNMYDEYPPLLVPQQHVKENMGVLIDLERFIPEEIIPWLTLKEPQHQKDDIFRRLGLTILDMLCDSESIKWNDWSSALNNEKDDMKPIGCFDSILLARTISRILDMRSDNSLSIDDLEAALSFQKKLAVVMNVIYTKQPSAELITFFDELQTEYDWRTCMTWNDCQYSISFNQDQRRLSKINIPAQLESIVNDLGGTCHSYQPRNVQQNDDDGWSMLFEGCKLSSCFITQLFAAKDYWTYHLMLLWNHPSDDIFVSQHLKEALYPSLASSTTYEYEQLLVRFLGKLYDSFDTAGKAIREYNNYTNQGIKALVELLNDSDAKIFWFVLYMCKLLKDEILSTRSEDSLSYSLSIIKAFNARHTWSKPFHIPQGTLASLRMFREALFDDDMIQQNIAKLWDSSGQETDDITNAMVIDVHYPFMDISNRSRQALSILAFCYLCDVFYYHHQQQQQRHENNVNICELLRVPILQIVEGLQASERRNRFNELASSQVQSRLDKWKKTNNKPKRRGLLRDVIEPYDKEVVLFHIALLNEDPGLQNILLQSLQLNEEGDQVSTKKNVHKKHHHIYCI